jgi:hypothetical protein
MTADTATLDAPTKPRKPPVAMNGVNTPALFATIGAVASQRELATPGTAVTYTVPLATAAVSGSPTSASPSAKRSTTA